MEKLLGKIDFAEFGTIKEHPFLIGLQLRFSINGIGVMNCGKYTVNITQQCRWVNNNQEETVTKLVEYIYKILNDAKVHYVSQLVGKPVEVTLDHNCFKDFRILKEVL